MHPLTDLTRRRFLGSVYTGLGGIGLMQLLSESVKAATASPEWQPGKGLTHHPAKAKRVLQIFCPGAASHMDLWEHKPSLEKYHGKRVIEFTDYPEPGFWTGDLTDTEIPEDGPEQHPNDGGDE